MPSDAEGCSGGRRRIYLMRHAEVEYFSSADPSRGAPHVALTPRGRQQASAAGRALRGVAFDRVITTGLPRTVETARLVLAEGSTRADVEVAAWADLEEFRDYRLEDIPDDGMEDAFLRVFSGIPAREDAFLLGERVGELLDRVNVAVDRLLADPDWETALVVAHGGPNRAILSRALTGQHVFLGHIEQSPACINVLDLLPGWFVRAVNIACHDPVPTGPRTTSIEELMAAFLAYRRRRPSRWEPGGADRPS